MNIKTLKELIADLPDDWDVCIEYDGPDALVDKEVDSVYISSERQNIVLLGKE